ncbi:MAG: RlmE family RNA methyltransferase, partial [Planctomycetes bacterium]|nr:RlmE family RNA methyltransferase [Planctomycetota bacterium]
MATDRSRPDHYAVKARAAGYAARSAFKLEEIDRKYRLFKKRMWVLDLGAAPGSWTQYAGEAVGPRGRVQGVDLAPAGVSLPPHCRMAAQDVLAWDGAPDALRMPWFDVVVSDMAPITTGDREGDHLRQVALVEAAVAIADRQLRRGGHFVAKMFQGRRFGEVLAEIRRRFEFVKSYKPPASRSDSVETFVVA